MWLWTSFQAHTDTHKPNYVILLNWSNYSVTFNSIFWKEIKNCQFYELFIEGFEMMLMATGAILMPLLAINLKEKKKHDIDLFVCVCVCVAKYTYACGSVPVD